MTNHANISNYIHEVLNYYILLTTIDFSTYNIIELWKNYHLILLELSFGYLLSILLIDIMLFQYVSIKKIPKSHVNEKKNQKT